MRKYLEADPRLDTPDRPAILDTPTAHAFSIGDDEVIAGTAHSVAAQIIDQCRAAGAGHFAANFNRSQPPETMKLVRRIRPGRHSQAAQHRPSTLAAAS